MRVHDLPAAIPSSLGGLVLPKNNPPSTREGAWLSGDMRGQIGERGPEPLQGKQKITWKKIGAPLKG